MRKVLLIAALAVLLPGSGLADSHEPPPPDPASAHVGDSSGGPPMTDLYPYLAVEKFVRGWHNLFRGLLLMEVPIQGRRAFEARVRRGGNYAENNSAAFSGGLVGFGYSVARVGIGVADVFTFWWPYWDPFMDPSVVYIPEDSGFQRDRDALPLRHRRH